MPRLLTVFSLSCATTLALTATVIPAQQRPVSGPVARYDMRAGTISGMAGMGGMSAMSMLMGGRGNNVNHELHLRLGTSNAPTKPPPRAEHFMPSVAKLGKSVLLVTPQTERTDYDQLPQKPKGRMLIYWGCGEHAPKGQPVVIDFARLAAGQVPPGLWTTSIVRDLGPTMANSRTFGQWPANDGKSAKPDSSLIGAHRITSNYGPEMSFTLAKDFMAPLNTNRAANPSGSTTLSWTGIPDATGYLAFLFGGKMAPGGEMGDMIMWTSSAARQFGGGLSDWLSPAQVASLVRDRTVMAPTTTSCVIPQEVTRSAPDFRFGTLTAFGPEENFAYPPRPADPRAAWALEWTARVRHRSTTSWMDAAGMGGMGMGGMAQPQQPANQPPPDCNRRGVGGILGGILKIPGC